METPPARASPRMISTVLPPMPRGGVFTTRSKATSAWRVAPAVDGLVLVAHRPYGAVAAVGGAPRHTGQHPQPSVLNAVGVLELVHQQMPKAALVVFQQVRPFQQELVAAQQQLGEVHQAALPAELLLEAYRATVDMTVPQYREPDTEVRRVWDRAVAKAAGIPQRTVDGWRRLMETEPFVRGTGPNGR